jgi:outer membrane protein assembly factor BamD (BamD/ComL family)
MSRTGQNGVCLKPYSGAGVRAGWAWLAGCLAVVSVGCNTGGNNLVEVFDWNVKPNVVLPPPPQATVYRAGHWDQESALEPGTLAGDCASAKVLFQRGDIDDACKVFHWLAKRAEKEKNLEVLEDALFYEAECYYAKKRYPKARDTYAKLLQVLPTSRYRGEAVQRQFEIAEYWLEDTREEMKQWQEVKEGKRWWVVPNLFNFSSDKPVFDAENHTLKAFEVIYTQDPGGTAAPHALYRAGGINFFRERYNDADTFYSLLVEQYPKSPLAPAALELAIQSKIQQVGGSPYDSRKLTEARQLVDTALRSYPELHEKQEFLNRTLNSIQEQQAAKDFATAEFYRRTHHPGSAYFYYEIVRRRYAGTPWEQKATQRMMEIRAQVEKEAATQ